MYHYEMSLSFSLAVVILLAHSCSGYHGTDNVEYHCWPLGANGFTPVIDCGGLRLEWPQPPPDTVEKGQKFNVTYRAMTDQTFYTMSNAFPGQNESYVREFCLQTTCPSDVQSVNQDNCCVWHANIHTCHPSVLSNSGSCTSGSNFCGPWVGNDGQLSTHTQSAWGQINMTFEATDVQVDYEGVNFIIAHLRVGNMQIALGQPIDVIPPRVCGDGTCTANIGETCESCRADCCPGAIVGIVLGTSLVAITICALIAVFVVYCIYRRKQFYDESWIVSYGNIHMDADGLKAPGSMMSFKNAKKILTGETNSYYSRRSTNDPLSNAIHDQKKQVFTETGSFEGRTVAIKRVQRRNFVLTNTVRKEVVQIRVLDHPNLCKFIGATVKDPINLVIITEYCPKGSLNDVLQNDDIPLNWGFRFSFCKDIACGMAFLHHKKIYHNQLTSSNCVIDDRWTIKITDFGLPLLRGSSCSESRRISKVSPSTIGCTQTGEYGQRSCAAKIYLPPEIKQHTSLNQPVPTSDVYSFAILLVEIATRMDPYSEEVELDLNNKPKISISNLTESDSPCPCPQEYFDLTNKCWSFHPQNRPTFEQIKKTLQRINPNKESPVDMMMIMMEKYSKHLESLVVERTQELIAEQNKTANLLYSMLPRPIAEDLKQGKLAPATSFKSATVFFSDIVGFTRLASTSTPMQVVNLLNDLYSTFDCILDNFDVYKVETVGDAYMVVSGVPKENGDRHAGEIASMAIELLAATSKFKIPHRPKLKLEIRIGIHSGPVCAGVIGQKMPRYCLFGDTVNTASRMETASEAMKIQCSDSTYELLKKLGGFHLTNRGPISIKGKGYMQTWWVESKDGKTHLTHEDSQNVLLQSKKLMNKQVHNRFNGNRINSPKLGSRESSQDSGVIVSPSVLLPGSISYEEL